MPRFLKPLILLVVAAAAAATFGVGTAQASKCSNALIHDWYVDGRIDQTYPVHCYREALSDIPEDQIVYGTLRDDLTRALQSVIRRHNGDVGPGTLVPGAGGPGGGSGGAAGGKHDEGFFHWLAKKIGPSSADSVPVPLLVLGGLALALIAAAAVSFFARRYQARRATAEPPPAGRTG
ncbi:MAG TPA: hypothetical protein VGJ23_02390 [Gaiellaceae bacterium]|jgi:hypothetical protein